MRNYYFRFLGVFMVWVFFSFGALAQWNPDLSKNLLVSGKGMSSQDLVQVGKTTDGGIYIAWISWENENAYVKLQLLDKEGNAKFGEGGMYVSKQPTPPWSSGYGFTVTSDNNVVIVNPDKRGEEWQAFAYKISPEGKHLWGAEGMALMKKGEGASMSPKVCELKDGSIIVGYQVLGAGMQKLNFTKLQADGTALWGGKIEIVGADGNFDMIPSGNNGFIVASFETGNYYASKYNATGDMVWDKQAVIDDSGMVKSSSEPCVVSDGEGGLVAAWRYSVSSTATGGKVQHIDSEGNSVFSEEFTTGNLPFITTDIENKQIYVFSTEQVDYYLYTPKVWKLDYTGKNLWNADGISLSEDGFSYSMYGINMCDENVIFVYRNASDYNKAKIEYTCMNKDGEILAQNRTVSNAFNNKGRGGITPVVDGQFVTVWTDKEEMTGGVVYAQNSIVREFTSIKTVAGDELTVSALSQKPGFVTVRVQAPEDMKATVLLTGMNGNKVVDWGTVSLAKGDNELDYAVDGMPAGMYILAVQTSENVRYMKIMVRN